MSRSDVEFVVIFQQQGPLGRVQGRRVGLWFDDHLLLHHVHASFRWVGTVVPMGSASLSLFTPSFPSRMHPRSFLRTCVGSMSFRFHLLVPRAPSPSSACDTCVVVASSHASSHLETRGPRGGACKPPNPTQGVSSLPSQGTHPSESRRERVCERLRGRVRVRERDGRWVMCERGREGERE